MEGDTPGTSFDGGRAAPPEGSVSGVPVVLQGSPKRGPDAPMVTRSQHEYQFTLQTMKLLIDFNNTRNPASKSRLSEAFRGSQMLPEVPKGSHRITKAHKGSAVAAGAAAVAAGAAAAVAAAAAAAGAVKPHQTPKAGATSASA
jgi:hypothetical protein